MNILILSWRGPGHPNEGGAEQATFEHAKYWIKSGHEVTLFTSSFNKAYSQEILSGIKIIRKGSQLFFVKIRALFWYMFAKHPKYDLVIDEFHGIPFFTPLYIRTRKLAFIHEIAKEVWKLNPWPKPFNLLPGFVGPIIEPLIFKLYKNIDFMTVSPSTRDALVGFGLRKSRVHIVYNGFRVVGKIGQVNKQKVIIYLGAISKDKGIEDAIRAFSEIMRKDEGWSFWIVGKGNNLYLRELKKLCKDMGIIDKTEFFDYVSEAKKFSLLSKAFLLINPSIHEGWGIVNIEANSVYTPIIGYDVAGTKDSVKNGKTGILVNKGDYFSLANNAIKLFRDDRLYKEMQNHAKKWSERFSWDKAGRESLELIESM